MHVETRKHKEEVWHYPDLGATYSTIERWTTRHLHFDDSAEREKFHALCLKYQPTVKDAQIQRQIALNALNRVEYEKDLASYKTAKVAWDAKSGWSRFWSCDEPNEPHLRNQRAPMSDVENFILGIEPNVDLFYGPISPGIYEGVIKFGISYSKVVEV